VQPHRSSALGYASAASAAHSRVYAACAAEAAASESSGLSVGGCPERCRYFRPYPVWASSSCVLLTLRPSEPGASTRSTKRTSFHVALELEHVESVDLRSAIRKADAVLPAFARDAAPGLSWWP